MMNDVMSYGWLWLFPLAVTVALVVGLVRWLFPQGEKQKSAAQRKSNPTGGESEAGRD